MNTYDKIIIGGGLYGLYSARFCGLKGEKVLVLEYDSEVFSRATYINQARVHMGYHYPRSFSTAIKSAGYFNRFVKDFGFCIHKDFQQIYATSSNYSWTNAQQFKKNFCKNSNIVCDEIGVQTFFKNDQCDGAFKTLEYTYDAMILKEFFLNELKKLPNVEIVCNARIKKIEKSQEFLITMEDNTKYQSKFILNSTYASINNILNLVGYENFKIKYELCEIILCKVSKKFENIGITVMDGPFFSIMPFGKTGLHSLTSVTFTPHITSQHKTPTFLCQQNNDQNCSPVQLGNCNICSSKPKSGWEYMSRLAKKYLIDEFEFEYESSLFSMKPILKASEIDDSRPTVIKEFSNGPTFVSVLSGKINTLYDLDEVLS